MSEERSKRIRDALEASLAPVELQIKDQSHLHAGHAGAESGLGHFAVRIVTQNFEGLPRIRRHQLVYDAVGELMTTDIHALSIQAMTPAEASA